MAASTSIEHIAGVAGASRPSPHADNGSGAANADGAKNASSPIS